MPQDGPLVLLLQGRRMYFVIPRCTRRSWLGGFDDRHNAMLDIQREGQ